MYPRSPTPTLTTPQEFGDQVIPVDPEVIVQPYRLRSDNAQVPHKVVSPYGPQLGTADNTFMTNNNGLSLTPPIRAWLELAGQNQVGLTIRHARGNVPEPWDSRYVVPPDDGTVI